MVRYVTSESVMHGHPDKVADFISDTILDYYLIKDPHAHVAVETFLTANQVILGGEVNTSATITKEEIENIVISAIRGIGYLQKDSNWEDILVMNLIHGQSQEIYNGVKKNNNAGEIGAGDQGVMFGYACDENDAFMPSPILYANQLVRRLASLIDTGELKDFGPDGKVQFTFIYDDTDRPVGVKDFVCSIQHKLKYTRDEIQGILMPYILKVCPMVSEARVYFNPSGSFTKGGPAIDCGLTGRKIIIDTYGGVVPHGGGAFSGKDPTKVDRSATYMTRYIAKNIVASGLAKKCLVQLVYAIGVAHPLCFSVDTMGTGAVPDNEIASIINNKLDLTPRGIIEKLQLKNPIYSKTSFGGHFGYKFSNTPYFTWENLDLVEYLQECIKMRCNRQANIESSC